MNEEIEWHDTVKKITGMIKICSDGIEVLTIDYSGKRSRINSVVIPKNIFKRFSKMVK